MNISETNGSIATKFYLKHHLGGGLAALGFGPDRIRTLHGGGSGLRLNDGFDVKLEIVG